MGALIKLVICSDKCCVDNAIIMRGVCRVLDMVCKYSLTTVCYVEVIIGVEYVTTV